MRYKINKYRAGNGQHKGKMVQVAEPYHEGQISFEEFCERAGEGTTVGTTDLKAVAYRMGEILSEFLAMGYSVDCGEIGIFRPYFSSKQIPSETELTYRDLKDFKIIYKPKKDLQKAWQKGLKFTQKK